MQKTKIEWVRNPDGSQGYTANPVKGYCPMACPYCYARRMYDRFGWDKTIRFNAIKTVDELASIKKPSRIFWGSTMELFGTWIEDRWLKHIFHMVELTPQHTHIFLTKRPENLVKWSPFPENCWVRVSATNDNMALEAMLILPKIEAKVKFISFEPLHSAITLPVAVSLNLGSFHYPLEWLDWLIIGAETGNRKEKPPLSEVHKWAKEIIAAADEAGIPLFIKDNLKWPVKRQEWPLTK